jgi:citrate lyase subunit beta/citryl-CoA lyase
VLLGAQAVRGLLPVCDHYSGVPVRMEKSLQLQAELIEEFGVCVLDVTLDCEDGAPAGGEIEQAQTVVALANNAYAATNSVQRRIGARLHAVDHPAFASDVEIVVGGAAQSLAYIMIPKVESVADVEIAAAAIDPRLPLHVLIESPAAVHRAFDIAAHPRVESISFGLMDFVSAHAGAIPHTAMGMEQFHHPLVVRAKLDIASACHAYGKVPSHCVVTELKDTAIIEQAARTAANSLGYTRMWSIHPQQIRPILRAFAPSTEELELAQRVIEKAHSENWAPIAIDGKLHDRASYRYFWQVLERAHQTGCTLPDTVQIYF